MTDKITDKITEKTKTKIMTELTAYRESINVSPETRKKYIEDYGKTSLPTEDFGLDKILKENYLLKYAIENPTIYVEKRNTLLNGIKHEVNNTFVNTYRRYTTGELTLPPKEAKEIAAKAAKDLMESKINELESILPSKFEGNAYQKILSDYKAKKITDFSNITKSE